MDLLMVHYSMVHMLQGVLRLCRLSSHIPLLKPVFWPCAEREGYSSLTVFLKLKPERFEILQQSFNH